jgi:hypothetical protein
VIAGRASAFNPDRVRVTELPDDLDAVFRCPRTNLILPDRDRVFLPVPFFPCPQGGAECRLYATARTSGRFQ